MGFPDIGPMVEERPKHQRDFIDPACKHTEVKTVIIKWRKYTAWSKKKSPLDHL